MGPGARPGLAGLSGRRDERARPCAAFHGAGAGRRCGRGDRHRLLETRRRNRRRRRAAGDAAGDEEVESLSRMARSRSRTDKPSPAPRERGDPSRQRGVGEGRATARPRAPSPGSLRSPPSPAVREREETRCGYVALIGAPNAGKSTLLNQLGGRKLAIVTPKVQTTRTRLLGIAIAGPAQLIFVDTPGIFEPRRRLDRAMVAAAWAGAADADATVLLVDAARAVQRGVDRDSERIIERLGERGRRAILALNKIDLVRRDQLLGLADRL